MLNTDFKILHIRPHLHKLIHQSQTGYIAIHNISHNIRKMADLIEVAEKENIEAVVISLNFEKAFDRVEHQAIEGTLRYFNFGDKLISWIML